MVETRSLKTLLTTGKGASYCISANLVLLAQSQICLCKRFPRYKDVLQDSVFQHFPQIGALHLAPEATQQISFPPNTPEKYHVGYLLGPVFPLNKGSFFTGESS